MSEHPQLADVQKRLACPTSVEDVRAVLAVLDDLKSHTSSEVAGEVEDSFRLAFERLRELTSDDPERAAAILTGDLLPRCLVPDRDQDDGFGYRPHYTFGEWLDELPEEQRHLVRTEAFPLALSALGGDGARNAIRLISCIGYWDDNVLTALDQIARGRSDETGDHALSALVSLRPHFDVAALHTYLGMLHARIPNGPNLHQLVSTREIGTSETAALVKLHWLAHPAGSTDSGNLYSDLARTVLTEIAARDRGPMFTEQVWDWLVQMAGQPGDGFDHVFSANNSLVNRLDIPAVVPELVRRAVCVEGKHRYIYYIRMLECERPAHLPGWDELPLADLAAVRSDAAAPTGMTGRFSTTELYRKEAAWDVLLCHGVRSALPPFDDALSGEGGYVIHRFLELGSCLAIDPLPGVLPNLLAGTSNSTWDEHERFVAQIGAIEVAHGAGTRHAFDSLLGYRQLGDGVLLSAVDALAETAILTMEGGDPSPVEQLFLNAESSAREDSRGAAAAALATLLEEDTLTPPETARAAALLARPTTDPYARRELLFAFATLSPEAVPTNAITYAEGVLTSQAAEESRDPRPAALALISRQPGASSNPEFLLRHLGVTDHGGVAVAGPSTLRGVAPHVVGRYFAAEPTRFGQAVATLIVDGDSGALAHVLPSVQEAGTKNPSVVLDALLVRLRRADTGRVADPALLRTLAAVAPDRLLAEGCSNVTAWLPQARANLADTLGRLGPLSAAAADARFELLTQLAGDGIYAVRRAAYRAAISCETTRFAGLVVSWSRWREQGRQGPRRYAAECAGWLPPSVGEEQLAALGWDQEPTVRKSYELSLRERRDRLAASEFESRVLSVQVPAEVLGHWRYGVALSRVGDDSTIRRLADRLGDGLPPSVRFWLKRVRKSVEKRWGEVTRKWPEPWYSRPGQLETFTGVLVGENGKEVALSGTLWLIPSEAPGGRSSWGGWATSNQRWIEMSHEEQLMIPGRRTARILVSSSSFPGGELVFSGNGPYPDLVQS